MPSRDDLQTIAFEAYQYLYPLVVMDRTRRQTTNVVDQHAVARRAPLNQFAHYREFPPGDAREVVRFNFDTLYSFAWLDVRSEPIILTVPHAPERYHLTPLLDMWTDVFAVLGTRTTGGVGGHYAITGPTWTGALPDGVEAVRSPTPFVWVMGRIQTNGPDDYPTVHAIQDQYRITPLSAWNREYEPPSGIVDPTVDDITEPLMQVNSLSGVDFFTDAAGLLRVHPPHPNDYPILFRLRSLGLVPGETLDTNGLPPEISDAMDRGAAAALEDLLTSVVDGSLGSWNGTWMTVEGGTYGTDYRTRAMVALAGLGCNLSEDALYPGTVVDSDGHALNGEHRYELRLAPEQLPKAEAFWSLTMYDDLGFQVPNTLDRFALGDRDPLRFEPDGSLVFHLQREAPGRDREANWLPTPEGAFQPMIRIYSPASEVLRHGHNLPPIERVG